MRIERAGAGRLLRMTHSTAGGVIIELYDTSQKGDYNAPGKLLFQDKIDVGEMEYTAALMAKLFAITKETKWKVR